MQHKAAFILLFAAVCATAKSDSYSEYDVCGFNDDAMQGTWVGLSKDLTYNGDRMMVHGDRIKVIQKGVTKDFKCVDVGQYYGEYLWLSKDNNHYLCVLKTNIGQSIVQRTIQTHTGNFEATEIPKKTDPDYANLCTDEVPVGGLRLRRPKYFTQ